jgi:intracellular septation protein
VARGFHGHADDASRPLIPSAGAGHMVAMVLDTAKRAKPRVNPLLKLVLEIGPLMVFFIVNLRANLFVATAVFMVVTFLALGASWLLTRHLPTMPLVTGVVVLVFGGLTLALHNETFIKIKPTIVDSLFGIVLLGGLVFGKALLAVVLDVAFQLTEEGWKKLTLRWGIFFFVLAAMNEVVWRNFSTDTWVAFKVWGVFPITFLFAMAQVRLLQRYELKGDRAADAPDHL